MVNDEEYDKIREFFPGRQYEIIIMHAALGGLRRGEIYNLIWNDINFDKKIIHAGEALSIVGSSPDFGTKGLQDFLKAFLQTENK